MERPMSGLVVQLWRRLRDFSEDERWKVRSGVLWNSGKMAMALLRREGKRFAPLLSSPSINDAINGTARSSIISEEITPQGACDGVFDRVWQWCRDEASISESESESDFQRRYRVVFRFRDFELHYWSSASELAMPVFSGVSVSNELGGGRAKDAKFSVIVAVPTSFY